MEVLNDLSSFIVSKLHIVIRYNDTHITGYYHSECNDFDELTDYIRCVIPDEQIRDAVLFIDNQLDFAYRSPVFKTIYLYIIEWASNMRGAITGTPPIWSRVEPRMTDLQNPEFIARLNYIRNILMTAYSLNAHYKQDMTA
jgi:hypothetical protein